MERQMTINAQDAKSGKGKREMIKRFCNWLLEPVDWLTEYYSGLLEQKLNRRQTLWLVNAQIALIMAVFPANLSLVARFVGMLWFGWAVEKCREVL
ncbi:MAG: hypothetical protein ACOYJG_03870 [Prevotella sp.]|jgi:hypothetical protein